MNHEPQSSTSNEHVGHSNWRPWAFKREGGKIKSVRLRWRWQLNTNYKTDLPDWAKPYAKDIWPKGSLVTDVNTNPYKPYGGKRTAGFHRLAE
jgi:hypothetical protein